MFNKYVATYISDLFVHAATGVAMSPLWTTMRTISPNWSEHGTRKIFQIFSQDTSVRSQDARVMFGTQYSWGLHAFPACNALPEPALGPLPHGWLRLRPSAGFAVGTSVRSSKKFHRSAPS